MRVQLYFRAAALGSLLVSAGPAHPAHAAPLGTGFTYQGQVTISGAPASPTCDFEFSLWDAAGSGTPPTGGAQIGSTQAVNGVSVSDGLFTVVLNNTAQFGVSAFTGQDRWLQMAVSCPAGGSLVTLGPRQKLTAAPYALYSPSAGTAADLNCSGCVSSSDLAASAVSTNQIGDLQVTTAKIGDSQVTSAKIADGTIDTADLAPAARGWLLGGNGGTTPGTNFVGTTDNQALELKVNGARALRLEPRSSAANVIGGHASNYVNANASNATIGGGGASGKANRVTDNYGTVGGGKDNQAGDDPGDGSSDQRTAEYATVCGGENNSAGSSYSTVGGGRSNAALAPYATVCGGGRTDPYDALTANQVTDEYGTVGGGGNNTAGDGDADTSDAGYATVAGGWDNSASAFRSTVGGGYWNTTAGSTSTIAGGAGNSTAGDYSTVGGGYFNEASGSYSAVAGGRQNTASGNYALAAGRRARAAHQGSFVWADSTDSDFTSADSDTFNVRAAKGVRLGKNAGSANIGPHTGQYYRDNAIIAWGSINANGTINREFGVNNVTRDSAGVYSITVDVNPIDPGSLVPVANAEVDSAPTTAAAARLVTIDEVAFDTFRVYITTGAYAPVDNQFTFIVTGRGAE